MGIESEFNIARWALLPGAVKVPRSHSTVIRLPKTHLYPDGFRVELDVAVEHAAGPIQVTRYATQPAWYGRADEWGAGWEALGNATELAVFSLLTVCAVGSPTEDRVPDVHPYFMMSSDAVGLDFHPPRSSGEFERAGRVIGDAAEYKWERFTVVRWAANVANQVPNFGERGWKTAAVAQVMKTCGVSDREAFRRLKEARDRGLIVGDDRAARVAS